MGAAAQGTQEWLDERSGFATASCFADVLSKPKTGNGESVSRRNYRIKLVIERLIGKALSDPFENNATKWGNMVEPQARFAIEAELGHIIHTSPFVQHREHAWVGCSPDGLIDDDGLTQIKCPYVSANHLETLEKKKVPSEYIAQVQGEMWVTGRSWLLFTSFDPRLPPHLQLYTQVVKRDEAYIQALQEAVLKFLREVDETVKRLAKK